MASEFEQMIERLKATRGVAEPTEKVYECPKCKDSG